MEIYSTIELFLEGKHKGMLHFGYGYDTYIRKQYLITNYNNLFLQRQDYRKEIGTSEILILY